MPKPAKLTKKQHALIAAEAVKVQAGDLYKHLHRVGDDTAKAETSGLEQILDSENVPACRGGLQDRDDRLMVYEVEFGVERAEEEILLTIRGNVSPYVPAKTWGRPETVTPPRKARPRSRPSCAMASRAKARVLHRRDLCHRPLSRVLQSHVQSYGRGKQDQPGCSGVPITPCANYRRSPSEGRR